MKLRFVMLAAAMLAAQSALAETRIFVVDNTDGYEIDRCLASGEPCGALAASAICRTRQFAKAVGYGHIDDEEITGTVPGQPAAKFANIVAVKCVR